VIQFYQNSVEKVDIGHLLKHCVRSETIFNK